MRILNLLKRLNRPKPTWYQGQLLPPVEYRLCGEHFKSDEAYVRSAVKEAERLRDTLEIGPGDRVLDIGCGYGRLLTGLSIVFTDNPPSYTGIDVNTRAITWTQRHLGSLYPWAGFLRINMKNERYNPRGSGRSAISTLPFDVATFDAINLYSVFSHLMTDDVEFYLREMRRILAPSGKVFLTAFVEDGVPEVEENPEDSGLPNVGRLHIVRYNREFFDGLVRNHGLTIQQFSYGRETDGQSAYILGPSSGEADE